MPSSKTSSPVLLRCKGVLFDMDGILISSIESVERSWTRWALMRGVDPVRACEVAHGRRGVDSIAILRPDFEPEAETRIIEGFEIEDTAGVAGLPGVLALLAILPAQSWTVVTSATEKLARLSYAILSDEPGLYDHARTILQSMLDELKPTREKIVLEIRDDNEWREAA